MFIYKIGNYKVVGIHKADYYVFSFVLSENARKNEYIFIEMGEGCRILNNCYNELLF